MRKKRKIILMNMVIFFTEIRELIKSPIYIILTVFGNILIGLFSFLFYLIEYPKNTNIHNFLDAFWWAMSTATTTGFGDITPVTIAGKVIGIVLMLTGVALFAMFTALFAETILSYSRFKDG